jgi:hypothetical protein
MAVLDPYRTLGLAPGATLDEVKAAYRRLAKRYHPDSAGSAAVTRFLEIQHAYEMLTTGRLARPVARPRPSRTTGGQRPTPPSGGQRSTGTARPPGGARPAGSASQRPRPRTGPSATGRPGGSGRPRTERPHAERAQTDRPRGGRRKATLGSTSYDEATAGPLDSGWAGASWYGTDSGTYWTVNPREYADPRKHGPEYQERARRASGVGGVSAEGPRASGSAAEPIVRRAAAMPSQQPPVRPDVDSGPRFPGILAIGITLFGLGLGLMTILALFARP